MRRKRRVLTGVIAICMCGSLVGCGEGASTESTINQETGQAAASNDPYGRFPETITMTIGKGTPTDSRLPDGETVEDNEYVRYISDKLNIKYTHAWQADSDTAYWEKVPLVLSSGDIPDVMVVREPQLKQMYEAGMIEDLTDAFYNNVSPDLNAAYDNVKGQSLESATMDGKLMGIPSISPGADAQSILWVRDDWRKKLNLPEPETMDDVIALAKAFKEQDPDGNGKDDTKGFIGVTDIANVGNSTFGFDPMFSYYDSYPEMWINDENGKPTYGSIMPQTKEALAKLSDLYAQGLIDNEFVYKDVNKSNELVAGGKAGLFFGPWWLPNWPLNDSVKQNPEIEWKAYLAPLDKEGEYNTHMMFPSRDYLVVRKGYEHPDAVVKTCNMQFDMNRLGAEGAFYKGQNVQFQWDCMPFTLLLSDYYEKEVMAAEIKRAIDGEVKPEDLKADYKQIYDYYMVDQKNPKADITSWSMSNAYLTGAQTLNSDKMNRVFGCFYGQTDTMEKKWANLKKLEDETFLKIVAGQLPIDEFDKFVEEWKSLGGDEITEEVVAEVAAKEE